MPEHLQGVEGLIVTANSASQQNGPKGSLLRCVLSFKRGPQRYQSGVLVGLKNMPVM